MTDADKYYDLISKWEREHLTEKQIVDRFYKMITNSKSDTEEFDSNHLVNNFDSELIYSINDALHWKGYSYQFETPIIAKYEFDSEEYGDLVSNCSKSKQKTFELLKYLSEMNNWRLTLNSLHFIKLARLFELGILPDSNDLKDRIGKYNLYDFYMSLFSEKHSNQEKLKEALEAWMEKIGLLWVRLDYMQFRMKMEYLLWTITQNDKVKDSYLKVNTIKVGFSICPREYFCYNDKVYYNESIHKNLVKYLAFIDRNEIARFKQMYQDSIDLLDDTGYKLLFNML